jgi:hypothetical protein
VDSKPGIEVMDVNMERFAVFRTAVRIVCPDQAAELLTRNAWVPTDRAQGSFLGWR